MSQVQEEVLNGFLAETIRNRDLFAVPERKYRTKGNKIMRCDVTIQRKITDRFFTAVECKIGQDTTKKRQAVSDAQRWLGIPECWNSIAICYPVTLSQPQYATFGEMFKGTSDLLMARVNKSGVVGKWHKGSISNLIRLADDVGANETYAITEIIKQAIYSASNLIDEAMGRELASLLSLPWEPKYGKTIDNRPARISCLILANMILLQNRMHSEGLRIPHLETLVQVLKAANKQSALLENWNNIRIVDYAPVVDPGIAILEKLPVDYHTEELIEILIEAVIECTPRIRGLRLDHAGPLYHGLLQTSKYDGSFYTSTAAAVLLAELALSPNWHPVKSNWKELNELTKLKICDPACGTGTLLMAAARTIEERFLAAKKVLSDVDILHLRLIEDVLYGLDINQHAIHLAACMLTLSAPKIDYRRMNLFKMQHGLDQEGYVRAGSLDILTGSPSYLNNIKPESLHFKATAKGYQHTDLNLDLNLENTCDLVIMNPPYTRNDIRNRSLPNSERNLVQKHEVKISNRVLETKWKDAINQTSIDTFFTPIGDYLLNENGTLALVAPFTTCTGAAAKGKRNLLTDTSRFHLELVITSHDNRRINFSENTNIHESLLVARRPNPKNRNQPTTAFVSLAENPTSASEAHYLAEAIHCALDGDNSKLSNYGTITWRSIDDLKGRIWNAACFFDHSLAEAYDKLTKISCLRPLGAGSFVEPDGRGVRYAFTEAKYQQSPNYSALWDHKTERQVSMRTTADRYLVPKNGKDNTALKLWEKRNHLLISSRFRMNLTSTTSAFSEKKILGSAFVPVTPRDDENQKVSKAWCVYLNSTFGVLGFLNIRQKNLTYSHFSLEGLRSLPVPKPEMCDVQRLASVFDEFADQKLLPLPKIDVDNVRHALDAAVISSVPNIHEIGSIEKLRHKIAAEPTVNLKVQET